MDFVEEAAQYWIDKGVPHNAFIIALGVIACLFLLAMRRSFPMWLAILSAAIMVAAFFAPLTRGLLRCVFADC
jgi:hypothetical protein